MEEEYASLDWIDTYDSGESQPVAVTIERTVYREAIYTVSPDGSDLRKLAWSNSPRAPSRARIGMSHLSSPEEAVRSFTWSPDGKRIAFVASYYGEPDGIYIANPDGTEVQQIFDLKTVTGTKQNTLGWILAIEWSQDGSRISFEAGGRRTYFDRGVEHPVAGVYTIGSDGSDFRVEIGRADLATYLEWPDRLEGTGPQRIVRYTEQYEDPETRGWILSTVPWGEADEKLLVRLVNGRWLPQTPH